MKVEERLYKLACFTYEKKMYMANRIINALRHYLTLREVKRTHGVIVGREGDYNTYKLTWGNGLSTTYFERR